MADFARTVQNTLGRPAIDETGVTGRFEWSARYRPDTSTLDAPVFVDAVRQELGLRIVERNGPYEVFVIDAVSPPVEN